MKERIDRSVRLRPMAQRDKPDSHPRRLPFAEAGRLDLAAQPRVGEVGAVGVEPRVENHSRGDGRGTTSCVWVTCAASLPSAPKICVCTTIVRRPTCSGTATARNRPGCEARKKLLFDSIVVVLISAGLLSPAGVPPRSSANAIYAPPCTTPLLLRCRSSASISPTTLSFSALTTRMPKCSGMFLRAGTEAILLPSREI